MEIDFFDKCNIYRDCLVYTIHELKQEYEIWFPLARELIIGNPDCSNEMHHGCTVQELVNTASGKKSYAWVRQ